MHFNFKTSENNWFLNSFYGYASAKMEDTNINWLLLPSWKYSIKYATVSVSADSVRLIKLAVLYMFRDWFNASSTLSPYLYFTAKMELVCLFCFVWKTIDHECHSCLWFSCPKSVQKIFISFHVGKSFCWSSWVLWDGENRTKPH